MSTNREDEYWAIDVPGLTEPEAARLVEVVKTEGLGHFGRAEALSPREWVTLHLDRASAQMVHDALLGRFGAEQGLTEELAIWLQASNIKADERG